MVPPMALSADTLTYTLSQDRVVLAQNGTGSFAITIPSPATPYGGIQFEILVPIDVEITSVTYSPSGGMTLSPRVPPGELLDPTRLFSSYFFSMISTSNIFNTALTCTVNVSYTGSAEQTITIVEIKQSTVNGHDIETIKSDRNAATVTLEPSGIIAPTMDVGIFVAKDPPIFYLDMEDYGKPGFGAQFVVRAFDFYDVSSVHLRFSYDKDQYDCAYAISDYLAAEGFVIDPLRITEEDTGSIRRVSMYLWHTTFGGVVDGDAEVELLNIYLSPKPPSQASVSYASVDLEHVDIVQYDGIEIDVDVTIDPYGATAKIVYYSIYDVNMDGQVTLADVSIVRANIGKDPVASSDELVQRSDVNRDGKIDMDDLLEIIFAYENALP